MYELNSIALRASYSMIFADDVNKYPANNLWSAICFKIMTRYTRGFFPTCSCNHSCYMIYVRFFVTYTCVFLLCGYKRAYTCAQKSPYICVTNKHVVYGVTESGRIRVTELYRQQKNPSCTMELKGNFGLNQSWLQWPR